MKHSSLGPKSLQQLTQLIEATSFLSLVNSRDALPESLGEGLPLIQVETEHCSALISLQGAHLLQFKTTSGNPLLWLSPNCDFTPGAALRGGVPICLPWFGPAPDDAKKPKHGFARNNFWQLTTASLDTKGVAELTFVFMHKADTLFGYDFSAELRMFLGDSAKLELTVNNTDFAPFDCSFAFHNYYCVDKLANASVPELTGKNYKDNFENHREYTQDSHIRFDTPVDRVFPEVYEALTIEGSPRIRITHNNCPSVITWNPGIEAAKNISDIGEGQEQFYICVERGTVLAEKWTIPSGGLETAWMEFKEI